VIITAFLIGFSVKKVEDFEIGILYNPNTVTLRTDKLYKAGTHMVSPGASFFTFPKNLKTIIMGAQASDDSKRVSALVARTRDALEVNIECSFQYKLD
jgi:hypothetical protein